ncbi:2-C-methyl-D-erythritol 4-phosphate cytidylyltransferase [Peptoanaerobacter stomatis]|uniref:2-C-methyl-D-erythritol 4-phosphate cytidylyltransferase n=1 Tax=Peptoanaerobacter stomatis TaxID=796937 RepID=J6HIY5_9FIRM|nr:2-C-methyl-D-erythritol 4-phosphate cytidylyltransferase [Peptoanaerobacter stomatis]EJU22588.1 2-C-methyl-D-erythritol 4-phosphate cytidylyltransferase [Peptoanaerobacter stomatis]NWO25457.1 2-C-methyl-D-erythritol 4-phosphate cytidylyltransferase [Peptostreptococcaceae bacterium oral taxon 081]
MNIAVILAGGTGSRMQSKTPKQFIKINGKPIISYTLMAFEQAELIDEIVIVCLDDYKEHIKTIISDFKISKFNSLISNGNTRQQSVFNAISHIKNYAKDDDIVLIHDGVRAMIMPDMIDKCVIETKKYKAVTLAQKTKNTMIIAKNGQISKYLDRDFIYNVQTPQSFKFDIIYNSHINAINSGNTDITDDTQIVMPYYNNIHIIENDLPNLKLTTKEDIMLFEYYLKSV